MQESMRCVEATNFLGTLAGVSAVSHLLGWTPRLPQGNAMMPSLTRHLAAATIAGLSLVGLPGLVTADYQYVQIAQNAFGSGFGTPTNTTFGLPALSNRGVVAFGSSRISGSGVNGTFVGSGGAVRTVAASGGTMPTINNIGTVAYSAEFGSGPGSTFQVRSVTNTGQSQTLSTVLFPERILNGSINNVGAGNVGFVTFGNPLFLVSRAEGQVVTVLASGVGGTFTPNAPALNDANVAAFRDGFGFNPSSIRTVDAQGTLRTLVLPTNTTIALDPDLNDLGQVAFAALQGPPGLGGRNVIVRENFTGGTPTVLISAGPAYSSVGYVTASTSLGGSPAGVALNNRNQFAFLAQTGPSFGVYAGANPATDRVIALGDALFGSTVTDLGFYREGLNDAGQVAFVARLANGVTTIVRANPLGTTRGDTQFNPILPDATDGGVFTFIDCPTGTWVDPPLVPGFTYEMTSAGSLFTGIVDFPYGFDSPFEILVEGATLGSFQPGQSVDFTGFGGGGVRSFTLMGISPLADAGDPEGFPLRLAFSTPTASFTMRSVPEPAAVLLTAIGLAIAAPLAIRRAGRRGPPRPGTGA